MKRIIPIVALIFCLAASNYLPQQTAVPIEFQGNLHLFAILGQSNASGRAPKPDIVPSGDYLYMFRNSYRWAMLGWNIDYDLNQVDLVSDDPNSAYSFGVNFIVQMEQMGYVGIGIIPCAKGSTSIVEWQRSLADTDLYGSCLKRIRAASTMGHLDGVLFYQGEREAGLSLEAAQNWATNFEQLISDLRSDTGDPDLPFVFAQIGANPGPDFPYWDIVQEQQASISIPNVSMITTSDLACQSDRVHLTASASDIVGLRFAVMMTSLLGQHILPE